MLNERDWMEVAVLVLAAVAVNGSGDMPCFGVLWEILFVALDDASVEADARKRVEDCREDFTAREAKAPKFLEATEDENIMVARVNGEGEGECI